MQAAMEADSERATVDLGTPSVHAFTVLGLNAVASMIDMSRVADPAHPSWATTLFARAPMRSRLEENICASMPTDHQRCSARSAHDEGSIAQPQ